MDATNPLVSSEDKQKVTKEELGIDGSSSISIPDQRWQEVGMDDLNQFSPLEEKDFEDELELIRKHRNQRLLYEYDENEDLEFEDYKDTLSRFLKGSSPFVRVKYRLVSSKPKKARKTTDARINGHIKVSPRARRKFQNNLQANAESIESFFLGLLPITESITSGVLDATEKYQQITGVKTEFPAAYLIAKAGQAVQLRINRHVAEIFDLDDRERRILYGEARKPNSK